MIKKQTTTESDYNNVESRCVMKCNHPINTTQHGKKKTIARFFLAQRKQSTGRKVIRHCRTGKIHPWSELPELFLILQMDFIKPSISFFQTCLYFSLAQMMQEKDNFYSFQTSIILKLPLYKE